MTLKYQNDPVVIATDALTIAFTRIFETLDKCIERVAKEGILIKEPVCTQETCGANNADYYSVDCPRPV